MATEIKEFGAKPLICIIDDEPSYGHALGGMLEDNGFTVKAFTSATDFLQIFPTLPCQLVVSDINMPDMSGFDLCHAIRRQTYTGHIPIILITGHDANTKTIGLDTGADDLISKPFSSKELIAKIKSLLAIREKEIETRGQLKTSNFRLKNLARFVPPNLSELISLDDQQNILKPHRALISVMFTDLRGFTTFSERAEPEEVLDVLGLYYEAVGNAAIKRDGTLGHLAGDGIMVFFNDPMPVENHMQVAIETAIEARDQLNEQKKFWSDRKYNLDFGIGVSEGYATIGGIGFDQFSQYSAIGTVSNFASRLCQIAQNGQILVSQRFLYRMPNHPFIVEAIGEKILKGISAPVSINNIVSVNKTRNVA